MTAVPECLFTRDNNYRFSRKLSIKVCHISIGLCFSGVLMASVCLWDGADHEP